ncbi:helix-turn-helix domain-containing protein [Paenibacillus cymbidii]|uniref:helix-turn-helix domain-containing protein n=1 Tax=Paenibacillus cymbidii TaxID=1639034 RepID=UPI001081D153|nr:AraC family transcriptional regulator [Paenibacillus cymbidii]
MSMQELASVIPLFEHMAAYRTSQTIAVPAGSHRLIVALSGHVSVTGSDGEPAPVAQAFACDPLHGPYRVQVPRTREASYIVLSYRVFPETSAWSLYGPLRASSAVKIKYMLDELALFAQAPGNAEPEHERVVRQVRKRLLLERVLFIYLYETARAREVQSSAANMEESLAYINEHYMLKLTLPQLAERAGVSVGHYTVLFKAMTGTTMSHYLRRLRIDKEKQMFRHFRLPAKEVAQRVGYADYFHFSRAFKLEAGCSPTAFLRTGSGEIE